MNPQSMQTACKQSFQPTLKANGFKPYLETVLSEQALKVSKLNHTLTGTVNQYGTARVSGS